MSTHETSRAAVAAGLTALLSISLLGMSIGGEAEPGSGGALRFDFPHYALGKAIVKTFLISSTETPPTIDGKLREPVWEPLPSLQVDPATTGAHPFHVRAAFDADALYLGVTCQGAPTKAEPADRDSNVWRDDCVEIWTSVGTGKSQRRYQFIVNAANAIYDARGSDRSYNPDWQHATSRTPKGWTVEAAIPRGALGLEQWQHRLPFNVGRNGPGMGHYAWTAYGSTDTSALDFHGIVPPAGQAQEPKELPPIAQHLGSVQGEALELRLERTGIQAGERYLAMPFRLRVGDLPLHRLRLKATVRPLGGGAPLASAECRPERPMGKVVVDLRQLRLSKAAVGLMLLDDETVLARASVLVSAAAPTTLFAAGQRAKILLDPPEGVEPEAGWPVSFGVPFPAGALWNEERVRLVNAKGQEIPHQKEVTGRWGPDGAVKWLRIDALVNPQEKVCFVEAASSTDAAVPENAVSLREEGESVVIQTGVYRYVLGKGRSPIREIWMEGRCIATSKGAHGLYVVDQAGRLGTASAEAETMTVEARGPVAACVRFEGFYRDEGGEQMAKHTTRVECLAGRPLARITHTLVLTNDTNKVWFKDIGWELAVAPGAAPAAWFGADRDRWDATETVALNGGRPQAFMTQDEHFRFGRGKNRSRVAALDGAAQPSSVREGEEMGDWAALHGPQGGLLFGCRDSARQHPKEFAVERSRIVLKLYSPRAGEELDFRAPAVAERCNFEEWHRVAVSKTYRDAQWMERVKKLPSNALGWAKTHELWLEVLPPAAPIQDAARRSFLHSRPVYAHVDPTWIYQTEVMGKLHPRDPEQFPDLERVAALALDYQLSRMPAFGEYGFMYYGGGPHIGYKGNFPVMKRWKSIYCVREAVWLMYVRSADRRVRELAFATNRGLMDYYMIHHDGKRKVKGAFVMTDGGDALAGDNQACLPFPWQGGSALSIATTTHLDPFLWMYHLAGDRRARDVVENYGEAVKALLRPHVMRGGRPIQVLKAIAQTYTLTWDPHLRAMADALGDYLYRPGTTTDVTDEKPAGMFYKLTSDLPSLIQISQIFGSQRYYDMALRSAMWRWYFAIPFDLLDYGYTLGSVGPWLYEQNGDPSIPEWLRVRMREAPTLYDSAAERFPDPHAYCGAYNYFFLRDFPFVQDLVLRTGVLEEPLVSWTAYEPFGSETSVFVKKEQKARLAVWLRGFGNAVEIRRPDGGRPSFPVHHFVGRTQVVIPLEAGNGVYEIASPNTEAIHCALATSDVPLVVRASGYWRPFPAERPPRRIFFGLPEGENAGRIFFEGAAQLYDPDGKPFGNDDVTGWVDLPADKPGVWSFALTERKLVKVENLPPVFAMRSAKHYFDPGVLWERVEKRPESEAVPPETVFVKGAIETKGNQALHLAGRRQFRMPAGPAHPSGDGTAFLPLPEGTIEFFYKPNWSTFEVRGSSISLATVSAKPEPWSLRYYMRPQMNYHYEYNLYGIGWRDGKWKTGTIRCYRRPTLIERDKWVHIAWTWSREHNRQHGFTSLRMFIYVDGRAGPCYGNAARYSHMTGLTTLLALHPSAAYDELRISDMRRYHQDFDPPSRKRELEMDQHTRALFHFNGDVAGESASVEEPIEAKLTK